MMNPNHGRYADHVGYEEPFPSFGFFLRLLTAACLLTAAAAAHAESPSPMLPGTEPLTLQTDFAADMVAGISRHLDRKLADSIASRASKWQPDFSSPSAYTQSVAANRTRFARIIGAVDQRIRDGQMEFLSPSPHSNTVGETDSYTVHAVRWPVLPGVDGEGLLLQPRSQHIADVVALPDADHTPEMLVGLAPGLPPTSQFARRLAENGCRVLIPVLIDRSCERSGHPQVGMTNQTHREWIYRMSFEVGRHIIGYEVQKVLAAVDWFARPHTSDTLRGKVGVIGYGEGGLIAMYAGALSGEIDVTVASGYFQSRQHIWQEPVYRNIWSLLTEFGDAEIAGLIAPRTLIVEAGPGPEITAPPNRDKHNEAAPGVLVSPPLASVLGELDRAKPIFEKLQLSDRLVLIEAGQQGPGTEKSLTAFLTALGSREPLQPIGPAPQDLRGMYNPKPRLHRQVDQLVDYTQKLLRESHHRRRDFWTQADASSVEAWTRSTDFYRDYFYTEVIGKSEPPSLPARPRTRRILDEPKFTGYEVMLDVWPDVFAYGVLLIPKDMMPGERRAAVVCQHGLEGRPDLIVNPRIKSLYHSFGAKLADEGFVVFAPQNPFIGGNDFRILQRKANPLKLSLFSIITRQHERILEWLAAQPFVDARHIGCYGISYGGKTAMRVPALLPQYTLSVCSADFNEYVRKVAGNDYPFGFMFVEEYEVVEFDLANTFNYGEMSGLIAPRPFMVERGHKDPVASDEWVSYEYAKVRRLYQKLGIPGLTEIEFFDGGHEIRAVGAVEFLKKHLRHR